MTYEYTRVNQLESPHSYWYSQFGGRDFLDEYIADRIERLRALNFSPTKSRSVYEARAHRLLQDFLVQVEGLTYIRADLAHCQHPTIEVLASRPPGNMSINATVDTADLMDLLLHSFTDEAALQGAEFEATLWLNRLVQRFEVTKRLWSQYLPGFRKGTGRASDISLYRRLALLLALAYARSEDLQYLSTLLKVDDLLFSLPNLAHGDEDSCSLALAVSVELNAVCKLISWLDH